MEAELIALALASEEANWLRDLLYENLTLGKANSTYLNTL
jgi:hypothetical protein